MRAFILATEEDNLFRLPRGRELNDNKIIFNSHVSAASYCGVDKGEIQHLGGPTVVRKNVYYRVWGPVARTLH